MKIIALEEHFQLVAAMQAHHEQARTFLENAPISPADNEKIVHGNAERVLKLAPMRYEVSHI